MNLFNNAKDALVDCKEEKHLFITTKKVDEEIIHSL